MSDPTPPDAPADHVADTAAVRAVLHGEREAAATQLSELAASMRALRAVREASPDDDEHDPEGPTLSSEWSQLRGLELAASARLGDADAALERLDHGRYGICLSCGRPIAPGRLEVRPTAALCVECAARAS